MVFFYYSIMFFLLLQEIEVEDSSRSRNSGNFLQALSRKTTIISGGRVAAVAQNAKWL